MSLRRPQTGFGPGVLTYEGMLAFQRLYSVRLTAWELDTIEELEAVWLEDRAEQAQTDNASA